MTHNSYKITIPKPCHADWGQMTPTEKGRFCAQCTKTVHDFTAMSDSELIRLLEKSQEKVCGRFTPQQLDRSIEAKQPAKNTPLYHALAGLIFLTAPQKTCATEQKMEQTCRTTQLEPEEKVKPGQKSP
jgi:hypothetical protein